MAGPSRDQKWDVEIHEARMRGALCSSRDVARN